MRASTSPAIDVPAGLVACLVAWIAFLPFTTLGIDPYHDGLMLKPAMDVVSGQTLFRDSLMMYGPLTTWLQASAMLLLGPTLRVLRLSTVVAYALAAGALVMCWRLVLPRPLALIAGGLWILFSPVAFALHPWPSVYALCFQSMALLALMRAVSSHGGRGWALASGVLAGLTLLSRQLPTGLFTCAGVLAAFAAVALLFPAHRRRAIDGCISAAAGIALVVVAFLVHLLWHGSLGAWWQQTVVWAWQWSQSSSGAGIGALRCLNLWLPYGLVFGAVSILALLLGRVGHGATSALAAIGLAGAWVVFVTYFGFIEAFGQGITPIALVLAVGSTLYAAVRERRAPREETVLALVALIVCVGSWTQAYPLGDPGHLFWAIGASYGFSVLAAWQLGGRRTALVAAVLIVLWAPFVLGKARQWRASLSIARVMLSEPPLLAGMYEPPHRAAQWTRLATALRDYSRARPGWAMLLEGDNMVAAALAPDLTNSDPNFVRFRHVPYDDARRAQFIRRERPLIFSQRPAGALVRQAMAEVGYRPLIRLPQAVLLAPGDPRPR